MNIFNKNHWALILGGSSGFGLASAKKLSQQGMNVCVVHRDRRGAMDKINQEFEVVKSNGTQFLSFNVDALSENGMDLVLTELKSKMGQSGQVRVLLHSIAFGNLKPIAPVIKERNQGVVELAKKLNIDEAALNLAVADLLAESTDELFPLESPQYSDNLIEDEDMARTIYSMGTSLLTWTQKLSMAQMFAEDARVLGLTSEGNTVAWRGYAAVSAAKVALESVSRSIAVEFAPQGIRSNIIQAGVTDTKALQAIPGSGRMKSVAKLKNPFKRLTTPEDVADVVSLLSRDEAQWINGALIRADGGEQIASF
ncbi:SDR family oxidoreductase [Marinicella litoralis]|uniref:NAD(P)-dependent dehydrogenase (Short-subunit alcohol dehydrogenase family) n=1 Tax=Marinicella litoralis TaxID=644220 RepID=A0A4V3DIL7_9GAMM|nr:SDR family oxidoreductase [Marinicella litoralis]TDR22551.1 NAD(P)-dependent dehydrogenase (short-subunit alcohol dehydrogenase family) [Marinicella litoralis]